MEDKVTTNKDKSMRKSQKKQIENILELLGKAHDAIKKALETGNGEIALTLLEQSQDSAIQIGEMIEESLGEDFATIGLLEAYCEQLYQTYEMIRQQQPLNINKICKSLRKELIRIENSVKNNISVRNTIVFLPYKASMWDSLESVWKAADADPECDAYVIPIPYFDKNPDGSFREEHYEGDQYPKYVPITRYDEFDLEAYRPDVIYIHNPYDEHNHVTSVHPYFYCKNLRNFTDKLVYIPYFVLNEIEPDDQAAIDGMKHFCFTPGTIYAHQVIVQSENMRQIYINEYIKAAKEMGLGGEHVDRKFLEKKFLGTGSPKIDKVLNTKKEDLDIPEEWLKIIEKPDGSRKKIVFYNTSVNALLHHSEKMLQKMESVFEIFKENQDEVALLWRPHPLIKATIESMRPQLWEAYKEIRDRYIAEGWGIYDDSADMDRAVVVSDAYYGDGSSVVCLYEKTQKTIIYQNVFNRGYTLYDCVISDVELFGVDADGSCLYCIDRRNGKVKWIKGYPYLCNKGHSYIGVIENGSDIVLLPNLNNSFAIYNKNSSEIKKIEISNNKYNYVGYICVKSSILLFPYEGKTVVELDLDTYKIFYHELSDKLMTFEDAHIGADIGICEDEIIGAIDNTNMLAGFNTITKNTVVYELGEKYHFKCACVGEKAIYLATATGDVVMWNKYNNSVEEIYLEKQIGKMTYWRSIYVKELKELWFFPFEANKILIVDEKDKRVCFITLEDKVELEGQRPCVCMAKKIEDEIWISMREVNEIICINIYSKQLVKYRGEPL